MMEEPTVTTFAEAVDFMNSHRDWANVRPASSKHDAPRFILSAYDVPVEVLELIAAANDTKVEYGKGVVRDWVTFSESVNGASLTFSFRGVKTPRQIKWNLV